MSPCGCSFAAPPGAGLGASGRSKSHGGREQGWLPRPGPSRLSAARLRKDGNWICLGCAPAPAAPTAGPRGLVARFAPRGVRFSTAGEWARAGRAAHWGRGALYKGGRRRPRGPLEAGGACATSLRSRAHRALTTSIASYSPRGPGRAQMGTLLGKLKTTWPGEGMRAGWGGLNVEPIPSPALACWALCLAPQSRLWLTEAPSLAASKPGDSPSQPAWDRGSCLLLWQRHPGPKQAPPRSRTY